jgi:hypothetical protein
MTNIITVWKTQKTEDTVTLANIHEKAARFQRRVYWGNMVEYGGSLLGVAIFGLYVWLLPGWMTKLGSALIIVAIFFIMWQLARRGKAHALPEATALGLVDFHRRELVRRRNLLDSAWSWYILPVMPGMVLMLLGRWYQFHVPGRPVNLDHLIIVLGAIIALLIVGTVRLVQIIVAGRLQRAIDELDKLG